MLTIVGGILALLLVLVIAHFALIEVGREVITLRTPTPDGDWQSTRLWIVDAPDGTAWLHSAGEAWAERFQGEPVVEIQRDDGVRRYRARLAPGPHPEVDALLREKYGLADVWVRTLAPCNENTLPVHLTPLPR